MPNIEPHRILARFMDNRRGSLAVKFAFVLPLLMTVVAGPIDYGRYLLRESLLRDATDAAALAAAKHMSLADASQANLQDVSAAVAQHHLQAHALAELVEQTIIDTQVSANPVQVTVVARQPFQPVFPDVFGMSRRFVEATSVAEVVGEPNLCVLALEPAAFDALSLARDARMTANNCAVFSNSTSMRGLAVRDQARLEAATVCSAGGIAGTGQISPEPYTDCPQFEDPLASRLEPRVGTCDFHNVQIVDMARQLVPGVYCGGLIISGRAEIELKPGIYAIVNGPLLVDGTARVSGVGVSFFLGPDAWLRFGRFTSVELAASKHGSLAGLLIFGSRQQPSRLTHTILSRGAQNLVGTVYLPTSNLIIDGEAEVGSESAYTAIVARRLILLEGPHLVLNSDYDKTDVPVPAGIRGAGQPARLVQ